MSWKTSTAPILAEMLVAFLFSACMGVSEGPQGADMQVRHDLTGSPCTSADTFKAAQAAMLSSCGNGPRQCHTTSPYANNLDLTTADAYANLVGITAVDAPTKLRVKPQDPDGSFLVQKLTNNLQASEGQPMPIGEAIMWRPPDPTALNVLKCWITLGALNN
jgi:hypothetical protein